ncbi:MAG: hypothetical protein ABIX01_17825 [Chitinophagaceae bacterium]
MKFPSINMITTKSYTLKKTTWILLLMLTGNPVSAQNIGIATHAADTSAALPTVLPTLQGLATLFFKQRFHQPF